MMSTFDNLVSKAKGVADAAGKKTGEVVGYSKLRYQYKQTQWDVEKAYSKLGAFIYESRKTGEDFTELIELAINEIDLLGEKMEALNQQILECKKVLKCSTCGSENERGNAFCTRCGSSLEAENEAAEREEADLAEDASEAGDAEAETIEEEPETPFAE